MEHIEYCICRDWIVYNDRYDNEDIAEEEKDELAEKFPNYEWELREMTKKEIAIYYIN